MATTASTADRATSARWLLLCMGVALGLRLLLWTVSWSHPERAVYPDTPSYVEPARELLENGSYPETGALRTPVYPLFIALVYAILGESPARLVLVQVILSALSVFGTWRLARTLMPWKAALAAAYVVALSLESITLSFALLSETLFTCLLLLSMRFWMRFHETEHIPSLVASAVCMGLGILCRPIALYFPCLLIGLWLIPRRRPLMTAAKPLMIYALVLTALIVPWVWRNARVVGLATVSTFSNYNLFYLAAASVEADLQQVPVAQVRRRFEAQVEMELDRRRLGHTEGNRARLWGELARQVLAKHPARYARLHVQTSTGTLLPDVTTMTEILGLTTGGRGTLAILQRQGLYAAVRNYFGGQVWLIWVFAPFILLLALTYLCAVRGMLTLARLQEWSRLFLLLAPLAYFLLLPGVGSLPRFRVPVVPYLAVLAGFGVAGLDRQSNRMPFRAGPPLANP